MTKPAGRYPFGNLGTDRGRDRLFTVGACLGFLLGLTVTGMTAKVVLGAVAVALVVVRTVAQYRYPDQDVPRRRGAAR